MSSRNHSSPNADERFAPPQPPRRPAERRRAARAARAAVGSHSDSIAAHRVEHRLPPGHHQQPEIAQGHLRRHQDVAPEDVSLARVLDQPEQQHARDAGRDREQTAARRPVPSAACARPARADPTPSPRPRARTAASRPPPSTRARPPRPARRGTAAPRHRPARSAGRAGGSRGTTRRTAPPGVRSRSQPPVSSRDEPRRRAPSHPPRTACTAAPADPGWCLRAHAASTRKARRRPRRGASALVRWNPRGSRPQAARSSAYDRFTSGRVTSCHRIGCHCDRSVSDALVTTVRTSS